MNHENLNVPEEFLTMLLAEADKKYDSRLQAQPFIFGAAWAYGWCKGDMETLKLELGKVIHEKILNHRIMDHGEYESMMAAIHHLRAAAKEIMKAQDLRTYSYFHEGDCHCPLCHLQHALSATSGYEEKA